MKYNLGHFSLIAQLCQQGILHSPNQGCRASRFCVGMGSQSCSGGLLGWTEDANRLLHI